MCCGAREPAPLGAGHPDPEGTPADDQWYEVSYFNGTRERVQGLEAVRRVLLTPEHRAPGTDENGFQGGSYARTSGPAA
jgi:hypothetical protein